jgi:putative transposase
MSIANPLWEAPRIHGELLKLGIQISQATVAKYMWRQRKPPSQTWRTFLEKHVKELVSADFLVVSTVSFRLLFVFVVLGHHRRRAIHFNVTAHPTAEWTARQIAEAFPGTAHRVICCMIGIVFTEQHSMSELAKWASGKC